MKALQGLFLLVIVLVAVILLGASIYTIREGEQAVITQFNRPVGVVIEAGLKIKAPFIQKVHRMEKRLLPWDGDPRNMQTLDKKRIHIDVWGRWRIVDPMKFFQALRTERGGFVVLDNLVNSAVWDVVARNKLIEVVRSSNQELLYESEELATDAAAGREQVSTGRAAMEAEIRRVAGADLKEQYGMELTEVHIKRINYRESVRRTVYERMKSERLRIARLFESEGVEEKNRIVGLTRKELDQILGEKEQRSAEIRGDANAEVIRIAADAFEKSPEFYEFLRRLEAYERTLGRGTRLILSSENEFFEYLLHPKEAPPAAP